MHWKIAFRNLDALQKGISSNLFITNVLSNYLWSITCWKSMRKHCKDLLSWCNDVGGKLLSLICSYSSDIFLLLWLISIKNPIWNIIWFLNLETQHFDSSYNIFYFTIRILLIHIVEYALLFQTQKTILTSAENNVTRNTFIFVLQRIFSKPWPCQVCNKNLWNLLQVKK